MHHIPGRLRLKFEQLKKRPDLTAAIEKEIGKLAGVTDVQARALTGSLLIRYDAAVLEREKLFSLLENVFRNAGLSFAYAPRATDAVADKLVDMMVEKCLERSALMLLGALL
jgi:hypothetical protein